MAVMKPKKNIVTKVAGAAVKAVVKATGKKSAKKVATKNVNNGIVRNLKRGETNGDYVVSGRSAKRVMPKVGKANADYKFGRDAEISKDVKIKDTKSPSGKTFYTGGALHVINQNARLTRPLTKAEAKANARGLKAANKKVSKNNRNRFGDGEMPSYLKTSKPARSNRTRLGKSAFKSK